MKLRFSLLPALVLILLVVFSSCTRNYICHCNISYSGAPGLPDTVVKEYDVKDTKKGAKSKCEGNSGTFDQNGIHTIENCYLY